MAARGGAVHVVTTSREYKGKVYKSHLLRRSYRENDKVKNETVGNLSHLPDHVVEMIRRVLKGESFAAVGEAFEVTASAPYGAVRAVAVAMQRLGIAGLLGSRPCREASLVMAMVAARILAPNTSMRTASSCTTSARATSKAPLVRSQNSDTIATARRTSFR